MISAKTKPEVAFDLKQANDSSISFSRETILDSLSYAFGFSIYDFNCDGRLDVSFFDSFEPRIPGTFAGAVGYILDAATGLRTIVDDDEYADFPFFKKVLVERQIAIDVDSNGRPDVVNVVNSHGAVAAYLNTGRFAAPWQRKILTGSAPGAVSIARGDIDGDGDDDIVVGQRLQASLHPIPGEPGISWLENPRGPGDWMQHRIVSSQDLTDVRSLIVADMNGDGKADIAASDLVTGVIVAFEGDGGVSWRRKELNVAAQDGYFGVAVDVEGDGKAEVLLPTYHGITIAWIEQNTGALMANRLISINNTGDKRFIITELDVADINRDGLMDIAFTAGATVAPLGQPQTGGVYYLLQTVSGWDMKRIWEGTDAHVALKAVDMDKDGDIDLVTNTEYNVSGYYIWRSGLR